MAGATVGVTGADDRQPPSMDSFRRRVLAEGRPETAAGGVEARLEELAAEGLSLIHL